MIDFLVILVGWGRLRIFKIVGVIFVKYLFFCSGIFVLWLGILLIFFFISINGIKFVVWVV